MDEKKKILFIVEAMGGGIFTYIVELANGLINDNDITIAYGIRNQTPQNFQKYLDQRIKLIRVENFTRELNPGKDLKAFFEIRKIIKEVNPDLIHLHSSKAGVLGRFAVNGKKIPTFYTPHGYSFLMQNTSNIKRYIFRVIELVCSKRKCLTVCCGKGEYEESLKITDNTTYINNGVNIKKLEELKKNLEQKNITTDKSDRDLRISSGGGHNRNSVNQPFTVCTLGRICYQKNPELFEKIARALPEVRFVWIGDGELRDCLKAPNIEITGWLTRNKALERSINSDAFILTSLWEGLPISLLESMYLKKPCIVSDVIGNHDVIQNGKNGFVCKTVQDYIEAINNIKNDNYLPLLKNAYDTIVREYNTTVMITRYSKLYQTATYRGRSS